MEKTQAKMVNSKKELKEFVDFLMDCWNNQLYRMRSAIGLHVFTS